MEEDKEITTYREFVTFAHDILGKKNKKVGNLYKLVAKPESLSEKQIEDIKLAFSRCFQDVEEWQDFSGKNFIEYKMGYLSLGELEKQCKKDDDDYKIFQEYIGTIRALFTDIRKSLMQFLKKLDLAEDSSEAKFMSNLFNELGGQLLDGIMKTGDVSDMASLMPRLFDLVKSGKISNILGSLKDGQVKFSIILRSFAKLVESYELGQPLLGPAVEEPVPTATKEHAAVAMIESAHSQHSWADE